MSVVQELGQRIKRAIGKEWLRPGGPSLGNGEVIAVATQKGGVGKTTTAVSLAVALAEQHARKVLLVDLDNQGHVASCLRDHLRARALQTVSTVLLDREPDLVQSAVPTTIPNLHLTGADKQLAATEAQISTRIGRELLLSRALSEARHRYDVIVLDCPPNLGLLTLNALVAADWLLVPCDLSILALEGVDDLFQTVASLEATFGRAPAVLGLLHTRVDRRNQRQNGRIRRAVQRRYGGLVLESEIGVNTAIADAQLLGRSVFAAHAESTGARDYRALAVEVVQKIAPTALRATA